MTETKQVVNYTDDQIKVMVADWRAGIKVEAIAEAMNKSVRSVVAKLVHLGEYTKPEHAKVKRITKLELVQQIAANLDLQVDALDSLTKCDKGELQVLADAVYTMCDKLSNL